MGLFPLSKEVFIMSWFFALFARLALLVVWLSTPLVQRAFQGGWISATAGAPPPCPLPP